jgi:hypothetical protein
VLLATAQKEANKFLMLQRAKTSKQAAPFPAGQEKQPINDRDLNE